MIPKDILDQVNPATARKISVRQDEIARVLSHFYPLIAKSVLDIVGEELLDAFTGEALYEEIILRMTARLNGRTS